MTPVELIRSVVSNMIKPLRNRVYMMITRAVIETVKDGKGMQLVKLKLLAGETRDDIERFQNFGFSSNPPVGSEALSLAVGGNREHLIVVAVEDRRVRVKNLKNGESIVYTDDGTIIHLKKAGEVEILAATKIDVKVPEINLGAGTLEKIINGEAFKTLYNAQTHNGNLGIPTGVTIVPLVDATHLSTQVKASR